MIREGFPIRRVIDLLAATRYPGARFVCHQKWQLDQANQWREYEVILANGKRLQVDARIAVVAERKGLLKAERGTCTTTSPWSKRDEADARGDWEYHCRQDDEGPACS